MMTRDDNRKAWSHALEVLNQERKALEGNITRFDYVKRATLAEQLNAWGYARLSEHV